MTMDKKLSYLNLGLVLVIALVLATKKLQRHTGIAASDWQKEILAQAVKNFNRMSIEQIQRFITEHYG